MNALALPHRGYHGPRGSQRFFEGWYYRLTLPDPELSWVTIYSIEDPHPQAPGRPNSPFRQGGVQVLGQEGVLIETLPHVEHFWASPNDLAFGQTQRPGRNALISVEDFWALESTGYQATAYLNQGQIRTVNGDARWHYTITPVLGWGNDRATMGLLSYLPVYEVGWQICMAHGWGTGFFEWQGQRYDFSQAPIYIEKNWGLGYPAVWFWLQCNSFLDHPGLTLTSGGGLRRTLWWSDAAAMIGLHHQGRFFEFRPETGQVRWSTQLTPTQGLWHLSGNANGYEIELEAQVPIHKLHTLLGPSQTATLHPISQHSLYGEFTLKLYRGRAKQRNLILEANSNLAAVEVGGDQWQGAWSGSCG